MAKVITAYQSNDGVIHLDKDAADYSDFSGEISIDVADFLKAQNTDDKDGHIKKMLIRWEVYKHGDFAGWLANRKVKQDGVVISCAADLTPEPVALSDKLKAALVIAESPKVYKKKVGIVGVWPGNQEAIKRQFGDIFDLAIYSADEEKKLHGLKEFHKVFALKKFISHRHVDILRSIGQEPMILGGSMSDLKSALIAYSKA